MISVSSGSVLLIGSVSSLVMLTMLILLVMLISLTKSVRFVCKEIYTIMFVKVELMISRD